MARLTVIGAGPIGLAAAVGAARRGLDVAVLERDSVGAALRRWGDVRFFSPLGMNLAPEVRDTLAGRLPPEDALLTGPQFVDAVLTPLAETLGDRVRCGQRVVAVGRAGMTRGDYAGHPIRAERPFRLLVEDGGGERWIESDAVIDASGVYGKGQAVWLGAGGVPAPGERAAGDRVLRDLGELHARRDELAGRAVLLVGHGHSAAHAILALRSLAEVGTTVVWATRSANLRPLVDVASDPLPERHLVVAEANALAAKPPPWLTVERRCSVERISEGNQLTVGLSGGRSATVDRIVGLTGYRPDLGPLSELAIEVSPTTEGAGRLSRALASVTDCLSVPSVSPADLDSGEPGFWLAGAKSYGRARTFLLRTGYAQLSTVLDRCAQAR